MSLEAPASRLPILFEENAGQADSEVRFISRVGSQTVYFTDSEILFVTVEQKVGEEGTEEPSKGESNGLVEPKPRSSPDASLLKMTISGANPDSTLVGRNPAVTKTNYIHGQDPASWQTGVSNYREVIYQDIYSGIDLVFYESDSGALEYDFVVSPGADPGEIAMTFGGAGDLEIGENGDLLIRAGGQAFVQRAPDTYQGMRFSPESVISSRYVIDDKTVRFNLGGYDSTRPLVIDPVLTYSTYLGGTLDDEGTAIAVDITGSAYVAGTTVSVDFPLVNAYDAILTGTAVFLYDAFLTKFSPDGSTLIYSTYFGGTGFETGGSVGVDLLGRAVLQGGTDSTDLPLMNAYQGTLDSSGSATFVTKFAPDGQSLEYSTYVNGASTHGLTVTDAGDAYLVGGADSSFSVTNAFQPICNWPWPEGCDISGDGFVMHMTPTGGVAYSSYLGGSASDPAIDLALDETGNAYVAGYTWSTDFPTTPGAFQPAKANVVASDAFVTKVSADGSSMLYSTYLGGIWQDKAYGIDVDSAGSAYVVGTTDSPNFPIVNPYDASMSPTFGDAFVTKFSPTADSLVYSTYLGGSGGESARGVSVDGAGNATVAGIMRGSPDFPVVNPIGTIAGAFRDTFVSKFNAGGSGLTFSTPLGGTRDEVMSGFAADSSGSFYVTGWTDSADYPVTPGAFQKACGDCAAPNYVQTVFVSKISEPIATSYLVEGATSGAFDTWVLLANPSLTESAVARIDFLTGAGRVFGPHITIPPGSRRSIRADDYVDSFDVSSVIYTLSGAVIAERATYGKSSPRLGAHTTKAIETLGSEWFLAEGATAGGFETWVLIANPSSEITATVTLAFHTDSGEIPGPAHALGPGKRVSIRADDYVDTYHVSTKITATGAPVAAERTTYVDHGPMAGATSSPGVTAPGNSWFLAEGATAGGFETWVLISNPDPSITADATVAFLTDIGLVTGPVVSVPPMTRRSVRADDYVNTYEVSTLVTAGGPGVVAERAMYSDNSAYGKTAASGEAGVALGYKWVVPEGATSGGYATWVLISNPDATTPSVVDLTYMTGTGEVTGPTGLVIPPQSRRSVLVNATVDSYDVSTRVSVASGPPVSVDRTLYAPSGLGHDSTSGPGRIVG